jgi:hypothetical protein
MRILLNFENRFIRTAGNADSHPSAPENLPMVSMTFIREGTSSIRRKLQ